MRTAAAAICLGYFLLQALTLGYGTLVNDREHLVAMPSDVALEGSALERPSINYRAGEGEENPGKWAMRYRLYSVEADEVYSIMALGRIKPAALQFDPHYYQYGGAYLYPLGGLYFVLAKAGILRVGGFSSMLDDYQRMDGIYVAGRAMGLIMFCLSGYVFFLAAARLAGGWAGLLCLGLYLAAPASVMFSQIIKPHWPALLWTNLAIYALARAFERGMTDYRQGGLGLWLGLAVGSATTYAVFSVMAWLAMAWGVRRKVLPWRCLVIVPLVAGLVFFLTNPYVFLSRDIFAMEAQGQEKWFYWSADPWLVVQFVKNSILPGFGVGLCLLFAYAAARQAARPAHAWTRPALVLLLAPIVLFALLTDSISFWHINFRYVPYLLPLWLLFIAAAPLPGKKALLGAALVLVVFQAVPLKLAYFDENDPARSTRLRAAAWVDANVPDGTALCPAVPTPAPFNTPPFDFNRLDLQGTSCHYLIRVERQQDHADTPEGWRVAERFRPRLSPGGFPLVFSHVNPQITVYEKQ